MDAKELVTLVNSNGFDVKGLALIDTLDADSYELATLDYEAEEVAEGVTLTDYRSEGPYITPFTLYIKKGESYEVYIDEADKDLI